MPRPRRDRKAKERTAESLANFLTALEEHHATEAARDGGLSLPHSAAHKYLSGRGASELSRLEMEGEGALVSSAFVTSFEADMQDHSDKFDAVRAVPAARALLARPAPRAAVDRCAACLAPPACVLAPPRSHRATALTSRHRAPSHGI